MATAGYDYLVKAGYRWADPARITYSIAPDGVQWISGINGINAAFDSKLGAGVWEREIARALATWESVANINLVPVADGNYRENSLGSSQGDPRFGDIRIGGSTYVGNLSTLAQTYFPPPQGTSAGGDVDVNLGMAYAIGANYDLYSVILHETGHSLGLDHPSSSQVVMRAVYGGVVNGLTDGDIAGIQSIYGARQADMYESQGYGLSSSKPIDLTSVLTSARTSTASSASLTKIGDVEWFSFVAPSYASGSWQVTASASNTSMLSPKVMVYDAGGNLMGQAADATKWSTDATASMSSIVPGQRYYAAVTGATSDVFAVGSYSFTVSMSQSPSIPTPPVATPTPTPTPTPVPTPPSTPASPVHSTSVTIAADRFELNNSSASATKLGRLAQGLLTGLTLPTADVDFFSFQAGAAGVYQVSAGRSYIQVLNSRGRVLAQGTGAVNVSATRNASFVIRTQAPGSTGIADYTLAINPVASGKRRLVLGKSLAHQETIAKPEAFQVRAAPAWAAAMRAAIV
ncbi:matrixin family metalloprotease [Paludisphaera mucosa]|uniref:Matrixin family metalloprotease n=1 Tax=Paludisphaera mucosa TaxID=3030827 RepID=A0ABT6F7D6_9BACT|nr:matrixin family metalloprotease [Paludisphaera mucosa]MDG3003485.1 matrixin family metalloprotease [Paludisphaera mucosa]